jgi:hypothetical protein
MLMKSTGKIKSSKFSTFGTVKHIVPNANAVNTCFNSNYSNYMYCYNNLTLKRIHVHIVVQSFELQIFYFHVSLCV